MPLNEAYYIDTEGENFNFLLEHRGRIDNARRAIEEGKTLVWCNEGLEHEIPREVFMDAYDRWLMNQTEMNAPNVQTRPSPTITWEETVPCV